MAAGVVGCGAGGGTGAGGETGGAGEAGSGGAGAAGEGWVLMGLWHSLLLCLWHCLPHSLPVVVSFPGLVLLEVEVPSFTVCLLDLGHLLVGEL